MRKSFALLTATFAFFCLQSENVQASDWSPDALSRLRSWMRTAPRDALPNVPTERLDLAIASNNPNIIDQIASEEALRLGRMHLLGCSSAAAHAGWNVESADEHFDMLGLLQRSLRLNDIDGFFAQLQPRHPEYVALRNAYSAETNSVRRTQLARNMERWRWMPLNLEAQHLIVNIPQYQVSLWQNGERTGLWPVIVGKKKTPTPVFSAKVTGVTFNPWWEIPQSIVTESVGALVRRNPTEARRRGYVLTDGRYRQRPGPKNALGLMKLVMPNPYSVYLHDTPNRALFEQETRMFSHGCIRTGDALGFASILVAGNKSRAEIDTIIAKGDTVTVPLPTNMPIYVTYFTAATGDDGNITYFPDIYGRDANMGDAANPSRVCAA